MIGAPSRAAANALAACAFAFGTLVTAPAGALDKLDKQQCLDAHGNAQQARRDGRFRAAREQLIVCSQPSCPALLAKDCTGWLDDVDREQPTILVAAKDRDGRDTTRARVFVDDRLVADTSDGRPIALDTGEHTVRVELDGGGVRSSRIVVRAYEKGRLIDVDFTASTSPATKVTPDPPAAEHALPRTETAGPHVATYILGGIAIVAAGTWATFAIVGKNAESDLASQCSPNCSQRAIDGVQRDYLVADVAMVTSMAALAGAVVIGLLTRHTTTH